MFGKRPSELTPDDIKRAVAEQVREGSEIEFKETLPSRETGDPWISRGGRVGDYARSKLVEEVIAFANTYGGWLLLGVGETDTAPKRANAVVPIRECAELADRLRLMCRDCIEPKLPVLEVAGVPMSEDGAGVVVFHVPRSRMAPHRHEQTRECYIRRADRTEKMTMREIQDLTLQVERGLTAIERRFGERREHFSHELDRFKGGNEHAFGLRATLVPLTPLYVDRVHGNETVRPPSHTLWGQIGSRGPFQLLIPESIGTWRPVIRGTILRDSGESYLLSREVHCEGLIEYLFMRRKARKRAAEAVHPPLELADEPLRLAAEWPLGLFGNALCSAEKFRQATGAPDVEYGLEFEITSRGGDLPMGKYQGSHFGDWLGPFPRGQTIFPRYSVGPAEEFQRLSEWFERDFWNAAGHDRQQSVVVDFGRALSELAIGTDADT